jgi:hypothetical protein
VELLETPLQPEEVCPDKSKEVYGSDSKQLCAVPPFLTAHNLVRFRVTAPSTPFRLWLWPQQRGENLRLHRVPPRRAYGHAQLTLRDLPSWKTYAFSRSKGHGSPATFGQWLPDLQG